MTTVHNTPDSTPSKKRKKSKSAGLTPSTESAQIKVLKDMLETNRVEAEGWRQVAQKHKATVESQLTLIDQQAGQIESLRRLLEEKEAFIDDLAGVKPKQKKHV